MENQTHIAKINLKNIYFFVNLLIFNKLLVPESHYVILFERYLFNTNNSVLLLIE